MFITKAIKCKVLDLTQHKHELLQGEYQKFQIYAKRQKDFGVYSYTKTTFDFKERKKARYFPQPMPLGKQVCKFKKTDNKLTNYWFRVPVKAKRGGIWLPIFAYFDFTKEWEIRDSKLIKKDNQFIIILSLRKEVSLKKSYSNVLAIDLGEKVMATVCGSMENSSPQFFGRNIRGIRRHYAWLRKRLGNLKLLKKIRQMNDKESRVVDNILHNVTRKILRLAIKTDSIIVLGNLKNIRKSARGKRFKRIVSNWSYYKFTQYLTYKANEQGIQVIKINEHYTSKTCSRCGEFGNRKSQGLFKCPNCSYEINADVNGARNILKRTLDYMSNVGAVAFCLKNGNDNWLCQSESFKH